MGAGEFSSSLRRIVQQGDEYAKLATFVSQQIVDIETKLNETGGKLPFVYLKDKIALKFDRGPVRWCFWVIHPCDAMSAEAVESHYEEAWRPLSESPVLTKARTLRIMPLMLESLANLQTEHIQALQRAVDALKPMPPNTDKGDK